MAEAGPINEIEVAASVGCVLGEGPHWSSDEDSLYFVDILNKEILRYNDKTKEVKRLKVKARGGDLVTFVIPLVKSEPNQFLIGLGRQVANLTWNHQVSNVHTLLRVCTVDDDRPDNRLNDAKVDREGRLWAGTMAVEVGT